MTFNRITHSMLSSKLLMLIGLLLLLMVPPVLAGTIANHDINGAIWYHKSSSDTGLHYVWQSQSASPSYEFKPDGSGTFHLYNGYNFPANVIHSSTWTNNWNWTTCYKGSGNAGSLNIWCRRTR
jgi:hypothetical protein